MDGRSFYNSRIPKKVATILETAGIRCLDLRLTDISDALLAKLAPMPSLEVLRIWNPSKKITDAAGETLAAIAPALHRLDLIEARITDHIAHSLSSIASLNVFFLRDLLVVSRPRIRELRATCRAGRARAGWVAPHRRRRRVRRALYAPEAARAGQSMGGRQEAVGKGLEHIGELRALRHLDLRNTWATDALLGVVAQCRDLQVLRLEVGPMTDEGFQKLAACSDLRELSINGPALGLTDRAMPVCEPQPRLERLDLYAPGIRAAELERLVAGLKGRAERGR